VWGAVRETQWGTVRGTQQKTQSTSMSAPFVRDSVARCPTVTTRTVLSTCHPAALILSRGGGATVRCAVGCLGRTQDPVQKMPNLADPWL
jgi:hypothetical protein